MALWESPVGLTFMVGQYVVLFGLLGWYIYKKRFKIGYKLVFTRMVEGTRRVVGEREFRLTDEKVDFKGKTFPLTKENLKCPIWQDYGWTVYAFDLDDADIKFLDLNGSHVIHGNPKVINLFVSSGVIAQLAAKVRGLDKMVLIFFVLTVLLVAAVCVALGFFLFPQLNPWIYDKGGVPPV